MKQLLFTTLIGIAVLASCSSANDQQVPLSGNENGDDTIAMEQPFPEHELFPSLDSLMISANVYAKDYSKPVIILCHQARFNKFEYSGVAERLHDLGYNCIAIDQRSGGPIATQPNETTIRALDQNLPIDFIDAEQDMLAAIDYAKKNFEGPIVLWGSSYSSTLALYIAIENEDIDAVVSFSPGNYMSNEKGSLIDKLEGFEKPMFVTSSKSEAKGIEELTAKMNLVQKQVIFKPTGNGHHGSRALWPEQIGGEEYWEAVEGFLKDLF